MKMRGKIIVGVVAAALVSGGVYVWASGSSQEPVNPNLNAPKVVLEKTNMQSLVSASGAVESDSTTNIYPAYSTQNYPIMEILVDTGDAVKKGDVLARLDMSKLEDEIEEAELNLLSTQATAEEDRRTAANAVETAETGLNTSRIGLDRQLLATSNAEKDLRDAEADLQEPFDSYTYDKDIEDKRVLLERAEDDLETAREDLADAEGEETNTFTAETAVRDAEIKLERTENDLIKAQDDLDKELADNETFDAYEYTKTINDKKLAYDRAKDAYRDAKDDLDEAEYNQDDSYDADGKLITAKTLLDQAIAAEEKAKQAVKDAETAYQRAQSDKTKAEADFKKDNQEAKDDAVKLLEDKVEAATNAFTDAQRAYEDAVEKLDDATKDETDTFDDTVKSAADAVTKAENTLFDAQRAYQKALSDKEHAIEDFIEANEDALEEAQRLYADNQEQLASSQSSLTQAQITLQQAQNKPDNTATSIELQELNLKKLYTDLAEGEIIATVDGVITENNAKVGALPSGILFVIEDPDNLYIAANIKEYSLSQVAVGQDAVVTTDATGDAEYAATVDYISPKAVSEAGDTSVEFEIHASFDGGDDAAIRIGMNAFVDVITDSRENIYAVPLSSIVSDERGTFVYTPNGAERTEIPVTVGIKTITQAEISGEGLSDGLEILTQPVAMPVNEMPNGMMF